MTKQEMHAQFGPKLVCPLPGPKARAAVAADDRLEPGRTAQERVPAAYLDERAVEREVLSQQRPGCREVGGAERGQVGATGMSLTAADALAGAP